MVKRTKVIITSIVGLLLASYVMSATVLFPYQGGTGIGTATGADINKCLKVSNNSPFTYTLGDCVGGETDPVWLADKPSYITAASATAAFYPLSANPSGYLTAESDPVWLSDKPNYASQSWTTTNFLGIAATATDSYRLGGQLPAYYYPASNPSSYITLGSLSASSPINYNNTTGQFTFTNPGYITGNQTITLGGILAGSGTTSITATTAAGYYMPTTTDQTNWGSGYTYRLTSATGTAPLTLTLNANQLTGSIAQATSASAGYLTSTDWNTFNGKQTAYANLTSIGGLANASGWLKNNGAGVFSYSTPTKSDVGLGNVDNVQQMPLSYLDTDGTMAANSDTRIPSQKAVKTYSDQLIAAAQALVYKGTIDASGNPNYPSCTTPGWMWLISVAGKIGGASGIAVEAGDMVVCTTANAGGTQSAVGDKFNVIQKNIDGYVLGPASSTDGNFPLFDGVTGKLVKNSVYSPASFQPAATILSTFAALGNSSGWLKNNGAGVLSYSTPTKSDVGLGNVENTALSTWPGTANITTLGTIGTGTWNGTVIGTQYGGTGQNFSAIATGSIPFFSGTGVMGATTGMYWDNTNSRLGIGTAAPSTKLQVSGGSILVTNGFNYIDRDSTTDFNEGQIQAREITFTGTYPGRISMGYDSVNDYSFIQSVKPGAAVLPLLLNPSGGNVGIGTTVFGTSAAGILAIANGTAPTGTHSTATQIWSSAAGLNIMGPNSAGIFTIPSSVASATIAYSTSGTYAGIDTYINQAVKTTSAPTFADLLLNSAGTAYLTLDASGGVPGNTAQINFSANGGRNLARIESVVEGSFVGSLHFYTNPTGAGGAETEKMTIRGNGNIGIGLTAPSAYLHIKAGTATASSAPLKFTSGTLLATPEAGAVEFVTDDYYATITTGAARQKFVLTGGLTSGRVPYATTNGRLTDSSNFTYNGTSLSVQTSAANYGLVHTDGTRTIGTYVDSGGGYLGTSSNNNLAFFTNGSAAQMTLTTAGNLGIGITAPTSNLHIVTSATTSYNVWIQSRTNSDNAQIGLSNGGGGQPVLIKQDVNGNAQFRNLANGYIAFDTGTGGKQFALYHTGYFELTSGMKIRPTTDGTTALAISNLAGTSLMNFDTTNMMVGIGTTDAKSKLTVNAPYGSTNNAPEALLASAVNAIGDATGSYSYVSEFQSKGSVSNNHRLQIAGYRRVAGTGWTGIGWRIQDAVDVSFTDGSKAYIEIGAGTDPSSAGNGFISFGTNGSDRLSIVSSGNVGIGTIEPKAKLHTIGTSLIATSSGAVGGTSTLEFNYASGTDYNNVRQARIMASTITGGGGDLWLQTAPSGSGAYATVLSLNADLTSSFAGNLTIGADGVSNRTLKINSATAGKYLQIYTTGASDSHAISSTGWLSLIAPAGFEMRATGTAAWYWQNSGDGNKTRMQLNASNGLLTLGTKTTANVPGYIKLIATGADSAYYTTIIAGANTGNTTITLPTANPAGTYLLNMTSGGQIGYDTNTYLTGNQTITLGGILAGSGTTSITATTAAGYYMPSTSDKSTWDGKQAALNGTGLVRMSGTSVSYDNNSYALATGSASFATVGTITAGTWQGTAITDTYISSAATWNAKQPQLNGTGFVKASGTTITYDNSTYLTGNQTITLSGAVTGSGATAITTTLSDNTISAGKLQGASSTKLATGTSGWLLKSLGDGTFGWDTNTYITSTAGLLDNTHQIITTMTSEQMRLRYDANNYLSVTVNSSGTSTFDAVSGVGSNDIVFADPVSINTTALPRQSLEVRGANAAPTALSSAIGAGTITIASTTGTIGSVIGTSQNGSSYDTYWQARNLGASSTTYNLLLQPLGGGVAIGGTTASAQFTIHGANSSTPIMKAITGKASNTYFSLNEYAEPLFVGANGDYAGWRTNIYGDTYDRFLIKSGGPLYWGDGGTDGGDVGLYRSAANELRINKGAGNSLAEGNLVANWGAFGADIIEPIKLYGYFSSNASATSRIGVRGEIEQYGGGNTNPLYGVQGHALINVIGSGQTVANVFGVEGTVGAIGAGTVTNAYAIYASTIAPSTTTITNAYGVYSNSPSAVAGTITNAWNIYAAGTAQSYFGGNITTAGTMKAAGYQSSDGTDGVTEDKECITSVDFGNSTTTSTILHFKNGLYVGSD